MSLDDLQTRFIAQGLLSLAGYEWNGRSESWVVREKRIKRGALADLRSGLGKKYWEMARVHNYVMPFLPERPYDERWHYLVATLFGVFPKHRAGYSLGAAFRPLRERSDSMEARFVALLNSHPDDLDGHLRHVVRLLASAKPPQPLDWYRLLDDMLHWDDTEGRVQLRWARDFYSGGASEKGSAVTKARQDGAIKTGESDDE